MKDSKLPQIIIRTAEVIQRRQKVSDQKNHIDPITKSLIGVLPKDISIEDYLKYLEEKFS